jgi:hypothetical protein
VRGVPHGDEARPNFRCLLYMTANGFYLADGRGGRSFFYRSYLPGCLSRAKHGMVLKLYTMRIVLANSAFEGTGNFSHTPTGMDIPYQEEKKGCFARTFLSLKLPTLS